MMSGDGIYSRYLQHHLTTGRYKFTVSVDDNEGQAFYLSPPAPTSSSENAITAAKQPQSELQKATPGGVAAGDYAKLMLEVTKRRCCGSKIRLHPKSRTPTGLFRRRYVSIAFIAFTTRVGGQRGGIRKIKTKEKNSKAQNFLSRS